MTDEVLLVFEHRLGHFSFTDLRASQRLDHRPALGSADEVEAESPEVSGVGGAMRRSCVTSRIGAFHRFPRHCKFCS